MTVYSVSVYPFFRYYSLFLRRLVYALEKSCHTVLSFSGIYPELALPFMEGEAFIDCSDLDGTVCYCDPDSESAILSRISGRMAESLHWIDSGDYHYLSALWLSRLSSPFDLLVFDHHPDMQEPAFGGILSCGGWVRTSLERYPFLRNVLIVGINPSLEGECEGFGERVKVLNKDSLKGKDPSEIVSSLPSDGIPLYVSIDKDVLSPEDARTDWDQGDMRLSFLMEALRGVFDRKKVIGADICGEILLHKGATPEDLSVNRRTDSDMYEFFKEYFD